MSVVLYVVFLLTIDANGAVADSFQAVYQTDGSLALLLASCWSPDTWSPSHSALLRADGCYAPAWSLVDQRMERAGRGSKQDVRSGGEGTYR